MARDEFENVDDLGLDGEIVEETPAQYEWIRNMPCWALSALLHLIIILIFINIVQKQERKKEKEVPVVVTVAPLAQPKPEAYDPTKKRDTKATKKVPGPKEKDQKAVKLLKEVEKDDVAVDMPQGTSLENLTNFNTDFSGSGTDTGTNRSMGVGGGVAGAYGERWGKGSLTKEGGSDGTEDVVRAALEWLRRHQSADGSWKCVGYSENCSKGKSCTNADTAKYGEGKVNAELATHDVGLTALAMLAFAGYGHTHKDGIYEEYVECLRKAVGYMKSVQVRSEDPKTNGRFGPEAGEQWIYDHAISTMAMCELYVMSNDTLGLKKSCTEAVKYVLRAQNAGRGWRYGVTPGDNDTSVTGWMVLALKTAKNANLDIPKEEYERAFGGALTWFNYVTATNGKTGYWSPGDEGSRLLKIYPDPYPFSKELSCMTAVSVLCRLFAGESRQSKEVQNGVKILMQHTPKWQEQKGRSLSTINMYYWYYGSYALFQFGGENWKKWNEDMIEALVKSQRQGIICEDGSWDPIDEWGAAGGRIYTTALGAMTLEVYYRFRRTQQGGL